MTDLRQQWGDDLSLSAGGDLALVTGSDASRERVVRRLLTNPGSYIWQPDYGAGLPGQVGQPARPAMIESLVRRQMLLEQGVGQSQPPVVRVTPIFSGAIVQVQYVDAETSEGTAIGLTVER